MAIAPTPTRGLTDDEAGRRLLRDGPNVLPAARRRHGLREFVSQMTHFFALLLWAAGVLALIAGMPQLGIAIFATYLVPPSLLFIPLTRVVHTLNLQNTIWSLVIVLPTISIPFSVWLLMGFFKNVPREIEEAALVDGASRPQAVFRVVLPISKAGLAAAGMFAFAISLQAFLYPLVFTSSTAVKPVTLGVVTDLVRGDIYYWGELMAGALIAGLPVAILFNVFLDNFVEGITGGAFK